MLIHNRFIIFLHIYQYRDKDFKSKLKKQGKKIPENDIWIAACAICADVCLMTKDAHFDQIDRLKRETW